MTDAVGGAAQRPSVIDSIAGAVASKSAAQVNKANANNGRQPDTTENSDERQDDRSVQSAKHDDTHANRKTLDKAGKTERRSDHDGKKKDDKDQSFEDTIDKLVTKDSSDKPAQVTAAMALPSGWNVGNTGQQTEGDAKSAVGDRNAATPADTKNVVLPGSLLKQQSVAALLDARQRLLLTQKVKEGGQDSASNNATETVQVTVNARQSHWLFDDAANATTARVTETLHDKGTPPASAATLNAAQVLAASQSKGDGKPASPSQRRPLCKPHRQSRRQMLYSTKP